VLSQNIPAFRVYFACGIRGLDVFGKSAAEYGYKGKAKSAMVAVLPFVFGYIEP
jgi:hypothetical protein